MTVNKQVLQLLKDHVANNPKVSQLSLDFMHINDMMPYMDLLAQLQNLKSLSLYNNRLKELPIDMSNLKKLEILDISNNLLSDVDMVVVSLSTLPSLKVLKFPVKKEKEGTVIQGLKNLTHFNDLHIIRQKAKKAMALRHMNASTLNEFKRQMIEKYRKVQYLESTYLNQKSPQNTQQKFTKQIQTIISESLRRLGQKQGELTESLEIIYFNKTKYQIYNSIKNRCINMAMDYYGELGRVIKDVFQVQNKLFQNILMEGIKLVHFQYDAKEDEREKKETMPISYENKMFQKNQRMEKEIKRIKKQKDELTIQIDQLQSQNKKYLESLVRYAKGDKSGFINLNQSTTNFVSKQNVSHSFTPISNAGKTIDRSHRPSNTAKDSIQLQSNYMTNGRNLTLKQLKDTIQQIYEGKQRFDKKNFDGRIARETMHQYLFTHLTQKYGLKSLRIEAASSIIGGIQTFSGEDNDVAVFGKILKNQVDQEFKNVQIQLKACVNNVLKTQIKDKMPFKSATQIQNIFREKINGDVNSEQIENIVKFCYSKTDSDKILQKIELLYKLNKPKEEPSHRRMRDEYQNEPTKKRLKFSTFLQTVLDFQLRNHERAIRPVVNCFKLKDRDGDGIVNEQQFILIIEDLCDESSNIIPDLLILVDPYDTKQITFSQVVRLVSNYPENNPILNRFIEKDEPNDDLQ